MADSPDGAGVTLRVVLADDQAVVREGLVTLLGLLPGVEVVGAAADGLAALDLVAEHRPDVLLVDLRMPRCDGVETTERVRAEHPGTEVVVLTTYADDESLLAAFRRRPRFPHQGRRRRGDRPRPALGRRRSVHSGRRAAAPAGRRRHPQRARAREGDRRPDRARDRGLG